jgi:hypothetical protein
LFGVSSHLGAAGTQHPIFGHSYQGLLLPLCTKRRADREQKGKKSQGVISTK